MCTHAAILSAGALVAQGSLDELRMVGRAQVRISTPDADGAGRVLLGLGLEPERPLPSLAQRGQSDDGALVTASLPDHAVAPEAIVAALVAGGVRVRGFSVEGASLEERFVALTGEGFDIAQ
jgi:ABC-2 type transport system ATP-binding protein